MVHDCIPSDTAIHSLLCFRKAPLSLQQPISEVTKRGREEQGAKDLTEPPADIVQTPDEVRHSPLICLKGTAQFKAGRLKKFVHNWRKLTSNPFILDTVQHCHIEFGLGASCNRHTVKIQTFNSEEDNIINAEISRLCAKGVLEETSHCTGKFISPTFI